MSIIDYACLLQDERPDLSWPEALQRATLSLTGRTKVPPGMPKTREIADRRSTKGPKVPRAATESRDGPPPEHILRNIERVKSAESERKRTGGTLPTASFVRGGTMIKR